MLLNAEALYKQKHRKVVSVISEVNVCNIRQRSPSLLSLFQLCLCSGKRSRHNSGQAVRLPGVCLQCDTSDIQPLFLEASKNCTTEAEKDIYYDYYIIMLPIFHGWHSALSTSLCHGFGFSCLISCVRLLIFQFIFLLLIVIGFCLLRLSISSFSCICC